MRSSAIRLPSGPTTAIDTGTPISSAFSIAALMNSRHSTARNFAMSVIRFSQGLFAKARGRDDVIPFLCFARNIRAELFRRTALDVESGGVQGLGHLVVLQSLADCAREFIDDLARDTGWA